MDSKAMLVVKPLYKDDWRHYLIAEDVSLSRRCLLSQAFIDMCHGLIPECKLIR